MTKNVSTTKDKVNKTIHQFVKNYELYDYSLTESLISTLYSCEKPEKDKTLNVVHKKIFECGIFPDLLLFESPNPFDNVNILVPRKILSSAIYAACKYARYQNLSNEQVISDVLNSAIKALTDPEFVHCIDSDNRIFCERHDNNVDFDKISETISSFSQELLKKKRKKNK